MGAVTFSIDEGLVAALKEALPLELFVETGTYKGDGVAAALRHFGRLITIEQSEALWMEAAERFRDLANVEVRRGDSAEELARLAPSLRNHVTLFWLDAHWCVADETAGEKSQCPLLYEIAAIGRLGPQSVVLIDDARLFLAPPPEPHEAAQWPSFDAIVSRLHKLSSKHALMVINDVIVFHPFAAQGSLTNFARRHGVDWLHAHQALETSPLLRQSLEEKEVVIQSLHVAVLDLQSRQSALFGELEEKEVVIQDLAAQLKAQDPTAPGAASNAAALDALQKAVEQLAGQQALLARSLEEKQAIIITLQKSLDHHSSRWDDLVRSMGEKDDATREVYAAMETPAVHLAMAKALDEKEAVIKELSAAVKAYRQAFSLYGFLIWPLNYVFAPIRRIVKSQLNLLLPRLGNLNQHAPRALSLGSQVTRVSMPSPPRVSIVTPSFGQAHFIERTMKSVIDQEYPNLEYVVQDGGSGDGTTEIVERYADRLFAWDSSPDGGQAQAINRGFARTSGEIMAWLNSDDILLPGALAHVADYFVRHPDVDVVYGHRVLIDENDDEIGRWVLPGHDDAVLSWADFVPQETLFWRRRIWEKAGGKVDESFRFALDWDLLVRFREAGARFARIPRFLGGFRIHRQQKTSASISDIGFQEMDRIRERVLGRVPSQMEVRKALAPYLLRHVATDLAWRIRNRLGVRS